MTESPFYNNPEDSVSILQVNKELLIINIDDTSVSDGYVGAQVTDDEGNPVEGIPVTFYIAGNSEPIGIAATDSEGYSRISATLYGAQVLRAVVQENDYYTGAFGEMNVALPPDILVLSMVIGSAFAGTLVISLIRKKRRGDIESTPKPVPPEVRKELEKEHELIPERRREETERKIAELDGGFEDADGS